MTIPIRLNVYFQDTTGNARTDWIFLNRDRSQQWVSDSPYIGTKLEGDIDDINLFTPTGVYMYEPKKRIIGLIRGIASQDITKKIGDTGTGRLYAGVIPYANPIEFRWEVVQVGDQQIQTSSDQPEQAITIQPFARPQEQAITIRPFTRPR